MMAEGGVSDKTSKHAEDTDEVESVKMLTDLAADYAEYMQINCIKEVSGSFYLSEILVLLII